jgi:hypothetical protein
MIAGCFIGLGFIIAVSQHGESIAYPAQSVKRQGLLFGRQSAVFLAQAVGGRNGHKILIHPARLAAFEYGFTLL